MTIEEVKALCDDSIKVRIANHLGHNLPELIEAEVMHALPDFCNDLNAMHEAEKSLDAGFYNMGDYLMETSGRYPDAMWHSTARHRAEAFLLAVDDLPDKGRN